MPHEHGAWAILAVPLLLGIAAAGARPGHALLAVAAVSAYLFSVPAVEWLRTRRPAFVPPAAVYGLVLGVSAVGLVVAYPAMLPLAGIAVVAGLVIVMLSVGGRSTSVLVSLVQILQAIALVPAAAVIASSLGEAATARATLAAALYLIGTVLTVRSMIRARGNAAFLAASIGFHAAALVLAAAFLPWPYAVLVALLLVRAVALPVLSPRLAAAGRRLRPIHIGLVEIAASSTIVVLAFLVGF